MMQAVDRVMRPVTCLMQEVDRVMRPVDLAVDWWSEHIYWADGGARSIVMTTTRGQLPVTIVSENLLDVTKIAINPMSG